MNYGRNPLQDRVDKQKMTIEKLQVDLDFASQVTEVMGNILEALKVIPPDGLQAEGLLARMQSLHSELARGSDLQSAIHTVNVSLGIKSAAPFKNATQWAKSR